MANLHSDPLCGNSVQSKEHKAKRGEHKHLVQYLFAGWSSKAKERCSNPHQHVEKNPKHKKLQGDKRQGQLLPTEIREETAWEYLQHSVYDCAKGAGRGLDPCGREYFEEGFPSRTPIPYHSRNEEGTAKQKYGQKNGW